jgi:hypothetical protein
MFVSFAGCESISADGELGGGGHWSLDGIVD